MSGVEQQVGPRRARRGVGRLVRLRRYLLGGAVVLVVAIAGLLGYARHRARQALLDLPRLLGADIKSETDGFTYSQTVKGRTLFTIHASKAIQHRDGKTTLRNVDVTLYGEPGSNRVDRIRGSEFEYDQAGGIVRAMGESEIDMASLAAADGPDAKRVHVVANGLVFDQKQGIAKADGTIRFDYGALQGTATGADFDAHTGLLVLRHDVHVANAEGGERQHVDAAWAELDRRTRVARLQEARLAQDGESLLARELVVRLRPDGAGSGQGSIERMEGSGGVVVRTADGATAVAPAMEALFTTENHLKAARLTGGVTLHSAEQEGHAATAELLCDGKGRASLVELQGAVDLQQVVGERRDLKADALRASLGRDAAGHAVLQNSVATGHAALTMVSGAKGNRPADTTVMRADTLRAFGSTEAKRWNVSRVEGEGDTHVEQLGGTGETRSSAGDRLQVQLLPATAGAKTGAGAIASFTQSGHVHMTDDTPAAGKHAAQHRVADAQEAEYSASSGLVVLTGSPTVRDGQMEVASTRIAVERETGNAEATGGARGAMYSAGGGGEPTNFTADHVAVSRAAKQAMLYGGAKPARVWTATSQIEAPVLEIDQAKGTLVAHAAAGQPQGMVVRAVLPGRDGQPLRLVASTVRYTGAHANVQGTVQASGGVRLSSSSNRGGVGDVTAEEATATLAPATARPGERTTAGSLFGGGALQQVVAEGRVRVQQPGRVATGQHLVYTAATDECVLTGGSPTVRDSVHGTVTGTSLLFRTGDDSVEVAGGEGQPVRTEIDAPARQAAGQGMGKQGRSSKQHGPSTGPAGQQN